MFPAPEILGKTYSWYFLISLLTLAVYVGVFLFYAIKKIGLSFPEALIVIYGLTIIGSVGARSFSVLENFLESDYSFFQYDFAGDYRYGVGHRWYGSIVLIVVLLPLFRLRYDAEKYRRFFDAVMLTACLALILGKVGCFLDGHYGCYGVPTSLPVGVMFKYGSSPTLVPVHPVQAYDSFFHLIVLSVMLYFWNKAPAGRMGTFFLLATATYNFFIEIIRTNDSVLPGVSLAQIVYLLLFIAGTLALLRDFRKAGQPLLQNFH